MHSTSVEEADQNKSRSNGKQICQCSYFCQISEQFDRVSRLTRQLGRRRPTAKSPHLGIKLLSRQLQSLDGGMLCRQLRGEAVRRWVGGGVGGIESGGSQGRGGSQGGAGYLPAILHTMTSPLSASLNACTLHCTSQHTCVSACAICIRMYFSARHQYSVMSLLQCKPWRRDDYHAAGALSQHLSSAIHYHRIHHSNE